MFEVEVTLNDGNGQVVTQGFSRAYSYALALDQAMAYIRALPNLRVDRPRDGDTLYIKVKYAP
jgi:hypothetical protein